ncbi:MAG: transporter substrate-binding domain-containing protein, partial [Caldilineaceae bacterium]|nr:transporter substrate-binding domain-containing protein [Caldilineaceae bacterium]
SAPTAAPAQEAAATDPITPTAEAVTPVITVGVNAEFEPFVYVDENGNLTGFDIDLMNALNSVMDFEVAYENVSFPELMEGLTNDTLDAAISGISITEARGEKVDFTEPYFASGLSPVSYFGAGQSLVTRTDNTTLVDVGSITAETKIGVKNDTTGDIYVQENTPAQRLAYDESNALLQALVNGEVDAAVLDTPVVIRFIKANPGASLKLVGAPLTEETYGIAVNKNRPRVLSGLNEGLQLLWEDGTYDAIFVKWFGTP